MTVASFVQKALFFFMITTTLRVGPTTAAGTNGEKIAIIGSGSWGTSIAYKLGQLHPAADIEMWTFEEIVDGRNLTEIINEQHTNPKYLPNVTLSANVVASPDLEAVCRNASLLVFVVPHQFLPSTLKKMASFTPRKAIGVSLTKGLSLQMISTTASASAIATPSHQPLELLSEMIRRELLLESPVAVLMGANVAKDVSEDQFVEATVACPDLSIARRVSKYFNSPTFETRCSRDVFSAEVCGALKNVVAMGAGFCDGLELGSSTKAAIIRKGLCEMSLFCRLLSTGGYDESTVLESCGLGDVIATSYGGRNRLCAAEFARMAVQADAQASVSEMDKPALWASIETRLLSGQKLQGLSTCSEAIECLRANKLEARFPLLKRIHDIALGSASPSSLVEGWSQEKDSEADEEEPNLLFSAEEAGSAKQFSISDNSLAKFAAPTASRGPSVAKDRRDIPRPDQDSSYPPDSSSRCRGNLARNLPDEEESQNAADMSRAYGAVSSRGSRNT